MPNMPNMPNLTNMPNMLALHAFSLVNFNQPDKAGILVCFNSVDTLLTQVRASLVNGDIQLMWNIIGDERKCTGYRLFAYMGATAPPISSTWTEVGASLVSSYS